MTSFVSPNLKFHNQYCPNHQVFPQHPTQQVSQIQDPIEDENDTDIEYVSTETPELSGEGTPDNMTTTPAHLVYTDENEVFETTFEGKSTKCSSVLCLDSIPASWKISDVFNFLQKCGILFVKMCEQSSAFIDQQNDGSKKAQVKFLSKMYAIFAKKTIELSTHKPPVMTQVSILSGQRNLMKTYHNEANTGGITKIALKILLDFFGQRR